tara:strand:- start:44 stop:442 length:399 start_codon:yes stop_codon:yes gene_type:complete
MTNLKENLKNISGLEFAVFVIGIYFFSDYFIYLSSGLIATLIISIVFSAFTLYVTYHRWVLLKLGNILFVLFCIANIMAIFYGINDYDYTKTDEFLDFSLLKRTVIRLTFLSKTLFIFPLNLYMVFKNAKKK